MLKKNKYSLEANHVESASNRFILFYIMVVMYSRYYFYETAVFLSYYCRMTEYMAHFVNSAHWLVEQCIVGKLQHHFYDTDIFLFFISYCPHHFLTFVLCYPCRMLHYIQSVPLCHVIFHHVYVYMCDHLKNKSPVVQYFAMFASPD